MAICTFFGHREITQNIKPVLKRILTELIEERGVDQFYVGNHGAFDYTVKRVLKDLKPFYPHINYAVILAYIPTKQSDSSDFEDTIFPEGLESSPPKFAIIKRNNWMLERAQFVVTYVTNTQGGAAHFQEVAQKKGKTVINIADKI